MGIDTESIVSYELIGEVSPVQQVSENEKIIVIDVDDTFTKPYGIYRFFGGCGAELLNSLSKNKKTNLAKKALLWFSKFAYLARKTIRPNDPPSGLTQKLMRIGGKGLSEEAFRVSHKKMPPQRRVINYIKNKIKEGYDIAFVSANFSKVIQTYIDDVFKKEKIKIKPKYIKGSEIIFKDSKFYDINISDEFTRDLYYEGGEYAKNKFFFENFIKNPKYEKVITVGNSKGDLIQPNVMGYTKQDYEEFFNTKFLNVYIPL